MLTLAGIDPGIYRARARLQRRCPENADRRDREHDRVRRWCGACAARGAGLHLRLSARLQPARDRWVCEHIASLPFSAPYNEFGYARELLGPETEFVSPNNDTLYVLAACDVRQGPLVLHVPDTGGRYYVLQFVDAWTNNFAYIGRRATGTSEGEFLLAADGRAGEAPAGMRLVSAPTGIFMIVGRVQVDGEADLPAVHALQDQFTITPLSVRDGGPAPATPGAPQPDPRGAGGLAVVGAAPSGAGLVPATPGRRLVCRARCEHSAPRRPSRRT